jgi:hypothetical protein
VTVHQKWTVTDTPPGICSISDGGGARLAPGGPALSNTDCSISSRF